MSEAPVTADTLVNDAVKQYPQTLYIFKVAGIDTCCGGALRIGEAAKRHGQDVDVLLKSIEIATANCACER